MIRDLRARLVRLAAPVTLLGTVAIVGSAYAGNYDTGSLASEFLQSGLKSPSWATTTRRLPTARKSIS